MIWLEFGKLDPILKEMHWKVHLPFHQFQAMYVSWSWMEKVQFLLEFLATFFFRRGWYVLACH